MGNNEVILLAPGDKVNYMFLTPGGSYRKEIGLIVAKGWNSRQPTWYGFTIKSDREGDFLYWCPSDNIISLLPEHPTGETQ